MGSTLYTQYRDNRDMLTRLFWLQNHSEQTARIYYTISNLNVEHNPESTHVVVNNWLEQERVFQQEREIEYERIRQQGIYYEEEEEEEEEIIEQVEDDVDDDF
jgi:hypothetical protein